MPAALSTLLALVAGAALAGLGQLLPPLHLLTHEFSQGFSLVGALGLALLGRWGRRVDAYPGALLLAGLAAGLGAVAVHLPVDGALHGCRTEAGLTFFWITWLPLAAFAAALGRGTRHLTARRWVGLLVLLLAADLLHDGLQLLVGVRVVDPLIGAPLFVDQRAELQPDALQVLQRAWLAGLALVIWLQPRAEPKGLARAAVAIFALVTLIGGSRLGLGWGSGRLDAVLDGRAATPHFAIHYPRGGEAELHLPQIRVAAEWQWASLAPEMGVDDDLVVELYLYDDDDQMEDLTGIRASHAWLRRVDLDWWDASSSTLRHELVHALHAERVQNPLLALNRGMVEGTAQAWEDGAVWSDAGHVDAAGLLANGDLPSAADFMTLFGFYRVNERTAYVAAGSFLGWLVRTEGAERLWQAQGGLDFAGAYGSDLDTLDTRWRAWLATVPVDLDLRASLRESYDRRRVRAYAAERCPKLGSRERNPQQLAYDLRSHGDDHRAATAFLQLFDEDGAPGWLADAARSLSESGEPKAALSELERGLSLPGLGEDERQDLLSARLSTLLSGGDTAGAVTTLDALSALRPADAPHNRRLQELLEDPQTGAVLAAAMEGQGMVQLRAVQRLRERMPDDPDVARLYAEEALELPSGSWSLGLSPAQRLDLTLALEIARGDAATCDALSQDLAGAGLTAVRIGERALAAEVAAVLRSPCSYPRWNDAGERLAQRVAWEEANPELARLEP